MAEKQKYSVIRLEIMADKIDIGLTLTGQDAIDFLEYMKNPTYTEEAKECMREAVKLRKTIDWIESDERYEPSVSIRRWNVPLTDKENISPFSCSEKQLNAFLTEDALNDQTNLYSITRVVKYDGRIIGFFTLIADNINISSFEEILVKDRYADYHYAKLPAIKIARLATDRRYERRGVGRIMLTQIFHLVDQIVSIAGCRIITVDAKRNAVDFYKKFAFHAVTSKQHSPYIPMYLDFKLLRDIISPMSR